MNNENSREFLHFKADRRGNRRADAPVRRHAERLYGPCQAIVRGVDNQGKPFTEFTALNNVSATGSHFNLQNPVKPGSRLFIVFAFSTVTLQEVQAPRIAARGEVCRVETDTNGVGLRFHQHRFL